VVGLAVAWLPGCKTRQSSVDPARAAPTTTEAVAPPEVEKKIVSPAERAAQRERLVTALTKHPEPYLNLRADGVAFALRPRTVKPVQFRLAIPGLERWSDANVGRFVVRLPNGTQETVPFDKVDANGLVSYVFPVGGPAMLLFCVGPKVEDRGAVWEKVSHCSKVIVNVNDGRQRAVEPDANVTHETGIPNEVTPMIAPVNLRVGSELPATFSVLNDDLQDFEVAALRPDGSIDHQTTNDKGVANFQISQPGRWVLRFVKWQPDGERVGELVFEIPENK